MFKTTKSRIFEEKIQEFANNYALYIMNYELY